MGDKRATHLFAKAKNQVAVVGGDGEGMGFQIGAEGRGAGREELLLR